MTDKDRFIWKPDDFVVKPRKLKKGNYSKDEVGYTSYADNSNEQCQYCIFYQGDNSCELVEGLISEEGWCEYFEDANKIAKVVEATHSQDGPMVALFLPMDAAVKLSNIVYELGLPANATIEKPENMHVTLAYCPDGLESTSLYEKLGALCDNEALMDCNIQGYGVFNGEGQKVLYATLDNAKLPTLRQDVCNVLDDCGVSYSKEHGFVPHITLAYFPEEWQLPAGFALPDIPVEITGLSVASGPDRHDFLLNSTLEKHCGVCEEDDAYAGAPVSRVMTFVFPNQGHANAVEIVAMAPAGLPPKPALWKPEGGEDIGLQTWIGGPQYKREEAAYRLDRCLGFYLVPVAYVAEANDEYGAAVYYTKNALPSRPPEDYGTEWIEKAGVLDYVLGQKDRGYKHNYLTHPDDPERMILFDNGLSFPTEEGVCHSPFEFRVRGLQLSDLVMTALSKCLADVKCWAAISTLVGLQAADLARERIRGLLEEGWPSDIFKMNSKHDDKGQFASGEGGGGAGAKAKNKAPKSKVDKDFGNEGIDNNADTAAVDAQDKIHAQARDYQESIYEKQSVSRTADESKAMDRYIGSDFRKINTSLRTGEKADPEIAKYTKDLDTLMSKSKLEESVAVYRGMGANQNLAGLKKGDKITDKGFVSTATSQAVAAGASKEGMLRLELPKGSHAAATHVGYETELLLPKGTKMKYTGKVTYYKEGDRKIPVYHMELIKDEN